MRGYHHAKPRSATEHMARKRQSLFDSLTAYAEHGRVCPSMHALAELFRASTTAIKDLLEDLKAQGKITWRIPYIAGYGRVREVTITSSGKTTALPRPKAGRLGGDTSDLLPKYIGPPCRNLRTDSPAVFAKRKAELEALDRAQREHAATRMA
jgi:hypothetical protein